MNRAEQLYNTAPKAKIDTIVAIRGKNRITGEEKIFISKQGEQQKMPARWKGKLQAGEEWVEGVKGRNYHAEENILRNPKLKDWDFIEGGVSTNVCRPNAKCGEAITDKGMQLGGPDFKGKQGSTTKRQFWRE
jgi:hypothetical protein